MMRRRQACSRQGSVSRTSEVTLRVGNQMTDHEAHEAAERFWDGAVSREPYPRTLERTVLQVLPLVIVKLPGLGVGTIRQWLSERSVRVGALAPDRGLRG